MKHIDRIFKLHSLLVNHKTPLSGELIEQELECSRATRERIIRTMRENLFAPIHFDKLHNGYCYDPSLSVHPYELPGLWFNAHELQALLACQHVLSNVSPGILQQDIAQLQGRLEKLLSQTPGVAKPDVHKIKILNQANRSHNDKLFLQIAEALFNGKRLHIEYYARTNDQRSERDISPQTLVRYRDNWYVDAWCHSKQQLRSFAVDRISAATQLAEQSLWIEPQALQQHFAASYGIFSGAPQHVAVLNFTKERARWVADELWHPQQHSQWLADGRYQLQIPFNDHRELLMDILKHGAAVEVLEPGFLLEAVRAEIQLMDKVYAKNSSTC